MSNANTPNRDQFRRFETTQWSLVLKAAHRSSTEGRAAFSELCERYWYPLYAYVRQNVPDVDLAEDLTQDFFAKVIEKNYIADADPNRGRFRTFLLTSLRNFMANEWDKKNAACRGGGRTHVPLKLNHAGQRFSSEPTSETDPQTQYERRWAIELLDRVLMELKRDYADTKSERVYDQLKQFLLPGPWPAYRTMADTLGMSEGAVKVAVGRLRKRYQVLLRHQIAQTVSDASEVDEEVNQLFRAFST